MDSIAKCLLCSESETCENRIANCNGCGLNVHVLCYDIKNADVGMKNWKCSPCQRGILESIICELCGETNGAFKQSVCGKWVHIICALFTDGVHFTDSNTIRMESINLSKMMNSKPQQTCVFCSKSVGFCSLCSEFSCNHAIHITCAQANDCLQAITTDKNDPIKLCAFCMDHKPNDSLYRLTSVCIQEALMKKKKNNRAKKFPMLNEITKIQMDRAASSSAENKAFEIESIGAYESNASKAALQTIKKFANDEIPSTSKPKLFLMSSFSFDGK